MEWRDEGVVLGVKKHGETSAIVEALTKTHGRHLGLVRGGRSTRFQGLLQPGNSLDLIWRARLDEHLGTYSVEPMNLRAGRLMGSALALNGLAYLGSLLRFLPERDPHERLYGALAFIADHLDAIDLAPALVARFETRILSECGFGLDLESCAASGSREDLIYVSPKSGRAVSASSGAPWRDKLLPLPAFLRDDDASAAPADVADAFRLTAFFLERDLFAPRGLKMPDARRAFLAAAKTAA
ncbi:MAG TPA: DNA repair protein RecO [Roseiarcus sp.]|nr:DNA repair protein RecO [Roseiarcus sp.]